MSSIDIIIVDDHQMIREGIQASLSDTPDIRIVGEAGTGSEALEKLAAHPSVKVVVMDISLGDGQDSIDITQKLLKQFPQIQVLVLTMHDEEAHITTMLQAGATGYLLKDTGMDELVTAIRTVSSGDTYFCKRVADTMMEKFMQKKKSVKVGGIPVEQLTKREREILQLIAEEFTNQEIAEKLFISPRTVDTHRRNLILKLNVKNTAGLVRYAIKQNLIDF
ncbi:MAG: response regulator transcription factor [Bacteroidota bacterium]